MRVIVLMLIGCWATAEELHPQAVTRGLFVGRSPESQGDWNQLAKTEVATIVCVDGPAPNAEDAHNIGARLIHVPLGYDGVSPTDALALVRVARECERPIYVFCHHGRHRGPTAAALIGVAAGWIDTREALEFLEIAGTDRRFYGLWRAVADFQPPPADAELPDLVSKAELNPFRLAMAQLDRGWSKLQAAEDSPTRKETLLVITKALQESQRATPPDRQDLHRRFAESRRLLLEGNLPRFQRSCVDCHQAHRD